jgi:diguanylate cyclase (GGDEF)-like protein
MNVRNPFATTAPPGVGSPQPGVIGDGSRTPANSPAGGTPGTPVAAARATPATLAAAANGPHAAPRVDPLTGLPDRSGFITEVRMLQNLGITATVIALDIEEFTEVNEAFGLEIGDALLRAVADRCAQVGRGLHGHCVVGRVGADEFALALVPPAKDAVDAAIWVENVLTHLQDALSAAFDVHGQQLAVRVVIGHAWMGRGSDAAETLQHAVFARRFGGHGRTVHSYEEKHGERRLTQALHEAIAGCRIDIALQPKVALATGELVGLEALARWRLADGEHVPPNIFVALAERHNLISQLGERVLTRALETLAGWASDGVRPVPIAVNFSAMQIHDNQIVDHVERALREHGVAPGLLELELTESKLLGHAESAMRALHGLRALGVCLSIDDFGTGYSSLNYLRRVPVHRLKIDGSFVRGIAEDPGAREIVHLLIQLAHNLNLKCVAEGIETRAQLALLREMGCDEGQGFLLATPMSPWAATRQLGQLPPWMPLFAPPA